MPTAAQIIVQRNGHLNSYDPELFIEGQIAQPSFGKGGLLASDALTDWLKEKDHMSQVRQLVAIELAIEASASM